MSRTTYCSRPVSRCTRSTPHDDPALCDRGGVERVQRLTGLEQYVVRDIYDVADRPHSVSNEPGGKPQRGRPDRHSVEVAGDVARAALWILDLDRYLGRERGAIRWRIAQERGVPELRLRRPLELVAQEGRDLARQAHHAHAVGAVGSYLELEDVVVEAEQTHHIRPELGPRREYQDPRVIL